MWISFGGSFSAFHKAFQTSTRHIVQKTNAACEGFVLAVPHFQTPNSILHTTAAQPKRLRLWEKKFPIILFSSQILWSRNSDWVQPDLCSIISRASAGVHLNDSHLGSHGGFFSHLSGWDGLKWDSAGSADEGVTCGFSVLLRLLGAWKPIYARLLPERACREPLTPLCSVVGPVTAHPGMGLLMGSCKVLCRACEMEILLWPSLENATCHIPSL